MAKKKYLPLYEAWMEDEYMDNAGLCYAFSGKGSASWDFSEHPLFELMMPEKGDDVSGINYWASESSYSNQLYMFNELRQNIILLMAAMNNEL